MKKLILKTILLALLSPYAIADICQRQAFHFDNLTVQTGQFSKGDCFVSLSPRKTAGLIYRSYLITSTGQLMVFNSFGYGPIGSSTGARVFHTYPMQSPVEVSFNEREVFVTLVTGQMLTVDKVLGQPTHLSDGFIQIDSDIRPSNNGGVELTMDKSLLLDSGFRMGGTPLSRLGNVSVFSDFEGDRCQLKNSELFDVKAGEVYYLYDNDRALRSFLKNRCPQLDF